MAFDFEREERMKNLLLTLFFASGAAFANVGEPLESLPIQDSGRVKPFDTFARESLQLIYGKKTYEGKSASEVVFTWLLVPDHWMEAPLIEIRHAGLKEALKITSSDKYFTPQSLFTNERVPLLVQELQSLRERQEKLNPYFQAVGRLENQLALFQAIRSGVALRFVPDAGSDRWKSVAELDGDLRDAFVRLSKGFVDSISAAATEKNPPPSKEFQDAVRDFMDKARAQAPDKYADMARIGWEEHFNRLQPFMWAWIIYLCALLFLWLASAMSQYWAMPVFWIGLAAAVLMHGYGMALRIYLAGRPPVSNMYETVVWVPFACVILGLILERFQKSKLLLVCAMTVAIFCLILTNLAPTVLDSSIQPLEPVLRSTFWLSTHVLIITLSYAAFFLAFALGDVMLFLHLKDEEAYAQQIRVGTQSIYRAIQVGIVLLAFGIILGGIWADYSWGRFWGWDPKETWALISLLGYVAVLHGRLVGWVKNFQLAAASVVAFSLVVMSWYGVNFALGAGLHTYGFGAGGVEYVAGFVVLHLLFVAYVSTVRYGRPKKLTNT
jgi:cytochrome c-type biogenesis protein CcsB